jgi:hypothetical protein
MARLWRRCWRLVFGERRPVKVGGLGVVRYLRALHAKETR